MITQQDIAPLTYAELHDLKVLIDERIRDMQEQGLIELKARFIEQANALGLTVEDIVGAAKPRRGRKRREPVGNGVDDPMPAADVQA